MEPITALLAGVLGSQVIAKLLIALRIVRVASTAVTVGRTIAGAAGSLTDRVAVRDQLNMARICDRFKQDLTPEELETMRRVLGGAPPSSATQPGA